MQEIDFSQKIALFFYFSSLDEAKAQSATIRILKKIRQDQLIDNLNSSAESSAAFVRITNQFNIKSRRNIKPTNLAFSAGHIVLPANSNWGPWFEFRKLANDKNFNAVLYSKILGIAEADIATGLGLPLGTVRYRIGRGLKLLGSICRPGASHAEP